MTPETKLTAEQVAVIRTALQDIRGDYVHLGLADSLPRIDRALSALAGTGKKCGNPNCENGRIKAWNQETYEANTIPCPTCTSRQPQPKSDGERRTDAWFTPQQQGAMVDKIVERVQPDPLAEFKNFHRLLCERFDYHHDERDWKRDQLSLIEWIAKSAQPRRDESEIRRVAQKWSAKYIAGAVNNSHDAIVNAIRELEESQPCQGLEGGGGGSCAGGEGTTGSAQVARQSGPQSPSSTTDASPPPASVATKTSMNTAGPSCPEPERSPTSPMAMSPAASSLMGAEEFVREWAARVDTSKMTVVDATKARDTAIIGWLRERAKYDSQALLIDALARALNPDRRVERL